MENNSSDTKGGFFQNDRSLVCSMLVLYSFCIVGLIAAAFWWLNTTEKKKAAEATATAAVIATRQAQATSTAIARSTEQAQYEFVERFSPISGRWRMGAVDSEYWVGKRVIREDAYLWEVREVKKTFISWADFYRSDRIKDFDVYVDTKVLDAVPGDVCSGFLFRISPDGWDEGGYYYALCNNSYAIFSYHTEKGGWEPIDSVYHYIDPEEWNRLEIQARGDHFSFFLNGELIYEMNDGRQEIGGLALVIELNEKVPATILFDNFGYQSR
jgi:hypothetical protein